MAGVLIGFGIVWVIIVLGYILGRANVLGDKGEQVLNRLAFFVASPALLFETIGKADFHLVLGRTFAAVALSAAAAALLSALLTYLRRRRLDGNLVMASMSSSYINASNLGLPVATYVLHNTALAAPGLIFQLAIFQPVFLILLESLNKGPGDKGPGAKGTGNKTAGRRWTSVLRGIVTNPLLIASAAGVLISPTGLKLPDAVYQPFQLVGAASVPAMLLAFGISLKGNRPFTDRANWAYVGTSTVIKLVAQPALAYAFGLLFGLHGAGLFAVVILAALPTAQNVFIISTRYSLAVPATKDTVLLTTAAALPAMLVIAALLS